MAIKFTTIRWKNFLSTGNYFTEMPFTTTRTTLILGENGSGKSTVLDALCFVLFNRPYRDINKTQLLNSVNRKRCVVEVEFEVGKKSYKVVRGMKPSIFEIYVDGAMIDQDASSRDYQKYLEETVLQLNYKSFTQIVILGSAAFTQFMKLPAATRREIIEDILGIQIFTLMRDLLKTRLKELTDAHLQTGRDLDLAMQKARVQEQYIKTLEEDKAERVEELTARLAEYALEKKVIEATIVSIEDAIADCVEEMDALEAVREQLTTLRQEVRFQERGIERLEKDASFFDNHDECPTCKQAIGTALKTDVRQTKDAAVETHKTALRTFQKKISKLEAEEAKLSVIADQVAKQQQLISAQKTKLYSNNQLISTRTAELNALQDKKGSIADEQKVLKTLARQVVSLNAKKTDLAEEKTYHEIAGTMLKDSGIKTRVIDQYLPVINKLVNKYLAAMDFFVQFTLDNEFKEVIKSRHRDEFSYASFSEGEKQRIDLALLFTWRTIAKMKNSASTNLLILDEVFDSSLDANATEYVMGLLLHTLSADSHVFVISHKPDALMDKFQRVLRFEKPQHFSQMVIA